MDILSLFFLVASGVLLTIVALMARAAWHMHTTLTHDHRVLLLKRSPEKQRIDRLFSTLLMEHYANFLEPGDNSQWGFCHHTLCFETNDGLYARPLAGPVTTRDRSPAVAHDVRTLMRIAVERCVDNHDDRQILADIPCPWLPFTKPSAHERVLARALLERHRDQLSRSPSILE